MIRMKAAPKKYRNVPVEVDGIRFDSKRESIRWHVLRLLEKSGDVKDLKRQVRYPLHVDGRKIGSWVADFDYVDVTTSELVSEDVKGVQTPLFKWKRKHFEAEYKRPIRITA